MNKVLVGPQPSGPTTPVYILNMTRMKKFAENKEVTFSYEELQF